MTIYDKFRDEKLQYRINREGAKISALSSGKVDIYIYIYVMVDIDMCGKSPIMGEWIYGIT